MLLAPWFANGLALLLLNARAVPCQRPDPAFWQTRGHDVTTGGVPELPSGSRRRSDRMCQNASSARSLFAEPEKNCTLHASRQDCKSSAGLALLQKDGLLEVRGKAAFPARSSLSSAATAPRGNSLYTLFSSISSTVRLRGQRSTLTRYNPGHALPQVHLMALPSAFGVRFHKCAQVKSDVDPPQLTFFLVIHNMGPVGGSGTNLFQVAVRDSISSIVPLRTEGKMVERGYQMFAIDSLSAGSQVIVNYTANVRSHTSEVLELPAFLTFSNTSQNDVSMFGPLLANLTLRVNSTDRLYPNHGVHFAGFVVGFFVMLILLSLGFLAMNLIGPRTRLNLFQQRRKTEESNPEYADCNVSETIKDEASFEDKMVDVMVLEDPQNMSQALENLEMSTLLRATSNLEATRVQIYKDVLSSLLSGLVAHGQASVQAQERLLSVLHGQLQGMEGRLKEQRAARMAVLAAQCNLETREEMEVEHHREAAEKATAELLCQHADQQELLRCSVLLEKLHKLSQSQLQLTLLVRHEEASAKVQRQIVEWRRVELHKIFSEELEEATRMGELEKSTARSLLHDYYECQDQLEEVLDVVLANRRFVLAERHAQRKFLVHSLHSLNSLISDTFSSTSSHLDCWFAHIHRGSVLHAEQIAQLQDKAQTEVVVVRQRLDEALTQEKRAMRCGLIKKRRELISDTLRVHRQREKELSALSKALEGKAEAAQHLQRWQNLLTAHSLELAELINNLDEEAAADIRKVTMRLIQSARNEVKTIQPSAAQDLLALLPAGKHPSLSEFEAGLGGHGGQGGSATLLAGQEKLHSEGKAALRTLSSTRESLQGAMERELQEQRELRAQCRAFFSRLCSTQSSLCEDDRLGMKLEFQKCLSVMDRCLVLPHAVSRAKVQSALAARRRESEDKMLKIRSKRKTSRTRVKTDTSDLLLFQKQLDDRIRLFEKETETEASIANKVLEEIQREREDELLSRADSLAAQMASLHYQKAERRTRVLETSQAVLTLHSLLMEELRDRKSLRTQDMAHVVGSYCLALEEAEDRIQMERAEQLDGLAECRPAVESNLAAPFEDDEEGTEREKLLEVQQECGMTTIVQEALSKRDEVVALLTERLQKQQSSHQAAQDFKDQMMLKRLHAHCDQDLVFASQLVKQSRSSAEVLLEVLRLLLPTLPEGELFSVTDALCPKQHPPPSSAEQEHAECTGGVDRRLSLKLRGAVVREVLLQKTSCRVERERLWAKWQSLTEKLLPRSCESTEREAAALAVAEKTKEGALGIYESEAATQRNSEAVSESAVHSVNETPQSAAAAAVATTATTAPTWTELNIPTTGERLFVFRCPPESCDSSETLKRKKKRNFLNLRKGSVAPTDLP